MSPERLLYFEQENSPLHYRKIWPSNSDSWSDLRHAVESGLLRPLCGENVDGMNLILNSYVLTDVGREAAGLPPLVIVVPVVKLKKKIKQESKSLFGDDE